MKIAILGWGSLIWNPGELPLVGGWETGGPVLPVEFSRASGDGRLTLVIDPSHGEPISVRFVRSAREELSDAISDLRAREKTVSRRIGFVDLRDGTENCTAFPAMARRIRDWARATGFDAVVWTDLSSNFEEEIGASFSVERAEQYLKSLQRTVAERAREYIEKAPEEVNTPLRRRVYQSGWVAH